MDFIYFSQGLHSKPHHARSVASKVVADVIPISQQLGANYNFIRIAALSGAAAVCLAAYGRHSLKESSNNKDYKQIYESANNMHFIHSVALLAVPLTKRPLIVSTFHILLNTFHYEHISFAKC